MATYWTVDFWRPLYPCGAFFFWRRKMTDGMEKGYVKLWRKSLDSSVIKNKNLWIFWSWCLMKATYQSYTTIIGHQNINLLPGQFVFGLKKCIEEIPLSFQETRSCIASLTAMRNLTIKSTNKFSIITICNWELYQSDDDINNKQLNKQITNKQQTNNNIQEDKELIELKRNKRIGVVTPLSELFESIEKNFTTEELKLKDAFLKHWTEKNANGKKERWQMQKTFDVNLRFRTWLRNDREWHPEKYKQAAQSQKTYTLADGREVSFDEWVRANIEGK